MAHVLMVGVAAHGHTHPHLPVIAELVSRGHRVTYAIPAPFAEMVAATGATPLVHTSVLPDQSRGEQWPADPVAGTALFLDEAVLALPQIAAGLGPDGADVPDLALYDIGGYPAPVLARRFGVPAVQLSPAMVAWDGFESDLADDLAFRQEPGYRRYLARFAAWLAEHGIDDDPEEFVGRPTRSIVEIPRALQPCADRVDPEIYTFVGPDLARRAQDEQWPAPTRPLVLVSFGSAYHDEPDLFRACAAAFAPLGWDVVLAVGPHVDLDALGELPPNVAAHRWVPQLGVLGRASAFVTHAGMGGCAEGLWSGVPMIAIPRAVDQFGNAAMLESLGVARTVPAEDATPEVLRAALVALTSSPEVAERVAAQREELRRAGGAAAAADVVEAVLGG
ncbi:macrolide family glycosyltransferase [Actinomycetospora cinnamomea]|uniref:MGT family glycosyltransferase n=1 Tax=Actinomycetospora cinnamomea TaxID=663609 RepID=A0A2U1F6B3_9PSEU|nr:macrolide family glycosyltransferase [Actinomycetospora cinnamomea]PVZ07708.1 MGT family glycosyltransferase [Actinomycetospora cinnamomea]